MEWWVPITIAGFALVAVVVADRLDWIDLSNKRRRSGGSGMVGIGDEVFHPTRQEAQLEIDRQAMLPAPAPLAGDDDKGVYRGRLTISVMQPGEAP